MKHYLSSERNQTQIYGITPRYNRYSKVICMLRREEEIPIFSNIEAFKKTLTPSAFTPATIRAHKEILGEMVIKRTKRESELQFLSRYNLEEESSPMPIQSRRDG